MTGVLALVAGVVLVGLAAWIPFAHRGEGVVAGAAARAAAAWLVFVCVRPRPGRHGASSTSTRCTGRSASPPNAAYKTVHFTASDGVRLEGWYRPSRNGASVLMISGGGGNRR